MFLSGTLSVIIGGPIALVIVAYFAPSAFGGAAADEVWRGLATVAGSWIGGGANQTAMKEVFQVKDGIFSAMIIVDVFVANFWMAFLLYGAGMSKKMGLPLNLWVVWQQFRGGASDHPLIISSC